MICEVWGTPSISLPPGPLWSGVVVPVWVPYMDQIELFNPLHSIIISIGDLKPYNCMQIICIR